MDKDKVWNYKNTTHPNSNISLVYVIYFILIVEALNMDNTLQIKSAWFE